MYAQLGSIRFEGLKSFDKYAWKAAANLAQHARIDGKPRLQKVGDNLDELQLDMLWHSRFCNPEVEANTLRDLQTAGAILPLITGAGDFVGDFVIASLDVAVLHTSPTGQWILARAQVSLLEHVGDVTSIAAAAAKLTAFANSGNSPVTVPFTFQSQSVSSKLFGDLQALAANTSAAEVQLNAATVTPAQATTRLSQAKDLLNKAKDAADKAEGGITSLQGVVNNATQLKNNIEATKVFLTEAINQAEDGNVSGALAATRSTQGALGTLTGAGSNVAVLSAMRRI
jgi:phage protein U